MISRVGSSPVIRIGGYDYVGAVALKANGSQLADMEYRAELVNTKWPLNGKLLMLEATPDGYREQGSVQALEGLCWTAPSFSDGRLYLRNHDELVVYDLR